MSKFRIVQTKPLTYALPYQVEERCRVWFLPWPVWRSLKEREYSGRKYRLTPRHFQSPEEAQVFTEQVLARRASRLAMKARRLDEQRQLQQLPRVVRVLPAMPA